MNRREFVAAAASLGVLGGGAAVATGRLDLGGSPGEAGAKPVEIETLDAPGSDAGTIAVPEEGRVTLVTFFATWCRICRRSMPALGTVYDERGDEVQFLSVTNEAVGGTVTREDVVDWWERHDGRWPVAVDTDLELTARLDASSVPTVLVLDADNEVAWSATGEKTAAELRAGIDRAEGG
ncbi:TlpA family protein disulfide reductase [Natronoarchaeum sp. GCM10025703]|uniref:TlpA family protein disulfide reductase n=1 Tax=unclassified Natronoarchaeum TaxID=2620183 RepID=UPI00360AA092